MRIVIGEDTIELCRRMGRGDGILGEERAATAGAVRDDKSDGCDATRSGPSCSHKRRQVSLSWRQVSVLEQVFAVDGSPHKVLPGPVT